MTQFNYALAALGATITGNTAQAGFPLTHIIDGSDSTCWKSSGGSPYWHRIDLGAAHYITDFRLVQGQVYNQTATVVRVTYSDDDVNYNVLADWSVTYGAQTLNIQGITHRYWKFTATAGCSGGWTNYTTEVIGPVEAPPPPDNPADEYIAAWLDGLEANYVPGVQAWLDSH